MIKKRWEPLPDAPYAAANNMVVAITDTEILLAAGIVPGHGYVSSSFVFNTETKVYKDVGHIHTGMTAFRCGVANGSPFVICIGGANEWIGSTDR